MIQSFAFGARTAANLSAGVLLPLFAYPVDLISICITGMSGKVVTLTIEDGDGNPIWISLAGQSSPYPQQFAQVSDPGGIVSMLPSPCVIGSDVRGVLSCPDSGWDSCVFTYQEVKDAGVYRPRVE